MCEAHTHTLGNFTTCVWAHQKNIELPNCRAIKILVYFVFQTFRRHWKRDHRTTNKSYFCAGDFVKTLSFGVKRHEKELFSLLSSRFETIPRRRMIPLWVVVVRVCVPQRLPQETLGRMPAASNCCWKNRSDRANHRAISSYSSEPPNTVNDGLLRVDGGSLYKWHFAICCINDVF